MKSIRDVCDVAVRSRPGTAPDAPPDLLVEVPHGATRATHFEALRARIHSKLPEGLEEFFFVNTDVGAPEVALALAEGLTEKPDGLDRVVVLRGLIPRTFIDCNRVVEVGTEGFKKARYTPALPEYVTDAQDVGLLESLYRAYQETAEQAYAACCGAGGRALSLHTYAPRSVGIHVVDDNIVKALREAYEPANYEKWERRPQIDMITEDEDGTRLAPADLIEAIRTAYARIEIEAGENTTYRLHPSTLGHRHSERYPGQVLTLEISRDLLADPFTPFEEMRIGAAKVERMTAPLIEACLGTIR